MFIDCTIVGIPNALGIEAAIHIIETTNVSTLVVDAKNLKLIMKEWEVEHMRNLDVLICTDKVFDETKEEIENLEMEVFTVDQLAHIGKHAKEKELEETKECGPDSIDIICCTSGSTGKPKGVMITHWNIISSFAAIEERGLTFTHEDVAISYLPLSHLFEHLV